MVGKQKRKAFGLTELQLEALTVLWSREEATTGEVHQALQASRSPAYTTVARLLSRLEEKGLVSHRKAGRRYLHRASVSRAQVRRRLVRRLLKQLFRGDPVALVTHLLDEGTISARQRDLIRAQLEP